MSINSASITLAKASNQYLTVTNNYNFTAGTASAWVKLTTLPSVTGYGYGVISCANNIGAGGFDVIITTANKAAITFGAGTNVALGTTVLTTGTWYHIAGVWTTADKKIYVNGSLETTNSNAETLTAGSATTYIGNSAAATTRYADMKVDDARIYNTNRTQVQISGDMSTELIGNETNLQAYWKLNSVLTDATSGAATLTNNGAAAFSADVAFTGSLTFTETQSTSDPAVTFNVTVPITATETQGTSDTLSFRYGWTPRQKGTGTWTNISHS